MREIKYEGELHAIIDSINNLEPGLFFYGNREDFIQVGGFRYDKGKELRNHMHIPRVRCAMKTQEIMIVFYGSCTVRTFGSNGKTLVDESVLNAGDYYISYRGGVGFTILEDDTRMLEIKNGPYNVENDDEDRVLINE